MTGPITFTLPEVVDLIQARDELTPQVKELREEVDRLRAQNAILREQIQAYWQDRRRPRMLATHRDGVVR